MKKNNSLDDKLTIRLKASEKEEARKEAKKSDNPNETMSTVVRRAWINHIKPDAE